MDKDGAYRLVLKDSAGRAIQYLPDLNGEGSPRWKQRAFYDFVKDLSPLIKGSLIIAINFDRHKNVPIELYKHQLVWQVNKIIVR